MYHAIALHKKKWIRSILLLVLFCMDAKADAELVYQESVQAQPKTTTTIYIKNNQVRIEEGQNGTYTLFNTQEPVIYTVNSKKSQYIEINIKSVRQRAQNMLIAQQQLKTQLSDYIKSLPSRHQQQAETYLQQLEQVMHLQLPSPEHQVFDKITYINGLACKVTLLTIKNHPVREICNATDNIIQESDFQNFLLLLRFMDDLDKASAQGTSPPTEGKADTHAAGLAVRIKVLPNVSVTELISVRQETLDEALFTIPSHYQLIDPFQPRAGVTLEQPFRPSSLPH